MANVDIEKKQKEIEDAFAAFEREYPDAAQAMKIMGVSFSDYLQALAALRPVSSISGSADTVP